MKRTPNNEFQNPIKKLINIVSKLRDPIEGCSWDIKQTHDSLIPYAIEEAYEVADAIRYGDDSNLCDELGDLLLQVIIHAQIANEEKRFNFNDVAKAASEKMIRRHPHVFQNSHNDPRITVTNNWEEIKAIENKISNSKTPIYKDLSRKLRSQPPLRNSILISKKLIRYGFNSKKSRNIWSSINENIDNLKTSLKTNDTKTSEDIIGNLIFYLINVSNMNKLNIEEGIIRNNKILLEDLKSLEYDYNTRKSDKISNPKNKNV